MDDTNEGDSCTSHKLDEISVLRLDLMDQLITCKKEMETSLQEGYFLLGKGRYIMGVQSVSMLQVPSAECGFESLYQISTTEEPLIEIPSLSSHKFIVVPTKQTLIKTPQEEALNVRKRRTLGKDVKSLEETYEKDKYKKTDPLNWFNALPPQSLRKAQQHFRQAVLQSAVCATIQSKLNALNQQN